MSIGEVVNGEMALTKFGLVAKQQWEKLPKRFPNIELGAFIIMLNHMHGIIVITDGRGTAGLFAAVPLRVNFSHKTRDQALPPSAQILTTETYIHLYLV